MPSPAKSKNAAINSRLEDELRARIDRIHKAYGTTDTTLLTHLLPAFCDFVEREKAVRFPIKILSVKSEDLRQVAEEKGSYENGPTKAAGPPKSLEKSRHRTGAGPFGREG